MGVMFKASIDLIFVIALVICGSSGEDGVKPTVNRIVGGVKVDDTKKYPYLASLQENNEHLCGVTILNSRWLLSAAHCSVSRLLYGNDWVPLDPTNMTIVVGTLHILYQDAGSQMRNVSRFVVYPDYEDLNITNDIALIQVTQPLNLSGPSAAPVRLTTTSNNEDDPKPRGKCVALGWGRTEPMRSLESPVVKSHDIARAVPDLMMVKLDLVTIAECRRNITVLPVLQKQNLCTSTDGGKDKCRGDSGGPLMCNGEQYGLNSWGQGCARKNKPSVWTRVDGYLPWIKKVTGRSGNPPTKPTWKPLVKPRASSSKPKSAGSKQNGYLGVVHVFFLFFVHWRDGICFGN